MMKTFKVKCKIITPLFMGGANQQPELRTQSINGVLRWWFRVLGGSIEDEKRLFGWASKKSNQGLVRIFIKDFDKLQKQKFSKEFDSLGRVKQGRGINYLGFSLDQRFREDQKGKIQREYLKENQSFNLKISFHPKATDNDIKKFFCALWLAFNLGNFGSRARRGFGSVMIEEIFEIIKENDTQKEKNITNNCFGLDFIPNSELKEWINKNLQEIQKVLNPKPRDDIPYVFNNFEIYLFNQDNNWENLLNKAGEEYKNFRRTKQLDDRIVFGLPIVGDRKYRNLRRASLLIFKVIKVISDYVLLFVVSKPNDNHKFKFHPEIQNVKWNLLSDFVKNKTKTKIFP